MIIEKVLIECSCGNWEEMDIDAPRHKSHCFEWVENFELENGEDGGAKYKCKCGKIVKSKLIETEGGL